MQSLKTLDTEDFWLMPLLKDSTISSFITWAGEGILTFSTIATMLL